MNSLNPVIGLISLIGLIGPIGAHAATPVLIVTWKARSYVPLSYLGKALPVGGTPLEVAAALFEGGRAVSLASTEVRWYRENTLVARGKGRTNFSFLTPRTGEDMVRLRVNIPNYQGAALDQFIDIPLVQPEAVIDAAALPKLTPLFYFFSIVNPSSLTTSWEEAGLSITLQASNKNNPLEFARAQITKP